jgi:hypothetical protein
VIHAVAVAAAFADDDGHRIPVCSSWASEQWGFSVRSSPAVTAIETASVRAPSIPLGGRTGIVRRTGVVALTATTL